jgi:hypothetical protein
MNFEGRIGRFMKQLIIYLVLLWLMVLMLMVMHARPLDGDCFIQSLSCFSYYVINCLVQEHEEIYYY